MKTETELKTYVIQIPDCSGSFAAFDFEADEWRSTNDLAKTWQVDELNASDAADNFRETFDIDRTNHIFAILLSEAIEEETAAVLMSLSYSQEPSGIVIKLCDTKATGNLVIPAVIGGLPVTRIESWAFAGCSGLTHVSIPSSVTSVGDNAFKFCTGFLNIPVNDIGFTTRTKNCLNAAKIKNFKQLAAKTEGELFKIPNFHGKSLNEVKEALHVFGLKLAEEKPA